MKARANDRLNALKDDLSTMAGSAFQLGSSIRRRLVKEKDVCMANMADRAGFVPREDFEEMREMLYVLRVEHEELKKQVETLKKANKKK